MGNVPTKNAIPTQYKGIEFRSRTEARWAVFFDELGIEWQYEPEGYQLESGWYLPDFWLPDMWGRGMFFEVKPASSEGEVRAESLSALTKLPVAVSNGNKFEMGDIDVVTPYPDTAPGEEDVAWEGQWLTSWDALGIVQCSTCGKLTISYNGNCPRKWWGIECNAPVANGQMSWEEYFSRLEEIPDEQFWKKDLIRQEFRSSRQLPRHQGLSPSVAYDRAMKYRFWNPGGAR